MARGRLAMLLVLAVALLAPAGLQADALSVTVTDTECIDEFVPSEGDSVFGYFVVFNKGISRSSDQRGGIYLTVTSPSGNTVCTLKGNSGEHIDFKAPRGGTYKFCFHNHYGAPATVSLYIHVGRIPNEHNLGKDGNQMGCGKWATWSQSGGGSHEEEVPGVDGQASSHIQGRRGEGAPL
ncbi:transmembrane emp24 domain-containing protein p24beta3-like isoform X2 [Lolium rigidum]|uniref:transmembrane emp24 domain-containing protein p24beta3-like isoform X2 n=1 Tax=Lolium rigidum TaxID=89674 RepID=UPI001F5C743A|nr:transmembrane emp24 domain-containing protein p24beta3-like isoform X2 [Lolium rigidum]